MKKIVSVSLFLFIVFVNIQAQQFLHPGIDMNQKDMDYMKKQVLARQEPWSSALKRLKEETSPVIELPHVNNIIKGGYGDIGGGKALLDYVDTVYNCALIWYITGEEQYARKALGIIENFSERIWFFEGNDAKLVGGVACYPLCAGAEILRYHYPGWTDKHTEQFSHLLMDTYYPLLRFYFPEANGNWNGVIARGLLSIAVFVDNRELFDAIIDHFIHGPANGSLFKYIYPSGQCQETTRDLAHVQMGLCEFGGAARIAYTQGVDLFSLGNNRLALGLEYTMNVMFGGKPQSYGDISTRGIDNRRGDYEYLYRHYAAKGVKMPMTERMCEEVKKLEKVHPLTDIERNLLIAFREEFQTQKTEQLSIELHPCTIAYPTGATDKPLGKIPANVIEVLPGEDLQVSLDKAAGTGQWVVAKTGIHNLKQTLKIPSGTHLAGEGLGTVLMFESVKNYAISPKDLSSMHDVHISNLVIEGATSHDAGYDPNTGRFYRAGRYANSLTGIAFLGQIPGSIKNIVLENITLINFSRNGIFITGAENLEINNCNISDNGSGIVPGPRLHHNLLLRNVNRIRIYNSRFDTSISGCGVSLANCSGAIVEKCEIARNAWFGLLLSSSDNITISGNLIEGNSDSGIMSEYLYNGCRNVNINKNIIQYNNGYGVETYAVEKINLNGNRYHLNGQSVEQENISTKSHIISNKR